MENKTQKVRQDQLLLSWQTELPWVGTTLAVPACRGMKGYGLSWACAEVNLGNKLGLDERAHAAATDWGQSSGWKREEILAEAPPSATTAIRLMAPLLGEHWFRDLKR